MRRVNHTTATFTVALTLPSHIGQYVDSLTLHFWQEAARLELMIYNKIIFGKKGNIKALLGGSVYQQLKNFSGERRPLVCWLEGRNSGITFP